MTRIISGSRNTAVFMLFACLLITFTARADLIILNDGTMLIGEVQSKDRRSVRFRGQVKEIWTTITFTWHEIAELSEEDGDQSDYGPDTDTDADTDADADTDTGAETDTGADAGHGPLVHVIPLHGQVGGEVDGHVQGTFDAAIIEACLMEAQSAGAELVILDVKSPGGLVSEMETICETIIDWHERLRIVAFAHEAYSAAAIISLSCRELAITPRGQLGAAVIIRTGGGSAPTAVDAKFASPHHAKQRGYMAASGQPYEVVSAMTIQETALWWSNDAGWTTDADVANDGDWQKVDTPASVLTLTADEAIRWGVASASARNVEGLLPRLGVEEAKIVWRTDRVERYLRDTDREYRRFFGDLSSYFTALERIRSGLQVFLQRTDLETREAAARAVTSARRAANNSGRRIQNTERTILARRVEIPDKILERIQEDRELLSGIPRLVRSGSIPSVNRAIAKFNEIIGEWNDLLGRADEGGGTPSRGR